MISEYVVGAATAAVQTKGVNLEGVAAIVTPIISVMVLAFGALAWVLRSYISTGVENGVNKALVPIHERLDDHDTVLVDVRVELARLQGRDEERLLHGQKPPVSKRVSE